MSEFPTIQQPELSLRDPVLRFQEAVGIGLPEYADMDRSKYDSYDPTQDTSDQGQLLYFYTEKGRERTDPRLIFIFRPKGFVLNYYNSLEPASPYTIRNVNNSLYGQEQRLWANDEAELAVEKAQIHMQGIDPNRSSFRDQLAEYFPGEDRFVTMGERMDAYQEYVSQAPSFKHQVQRQIVASISSTIWNTWKENPQKVQELVVERIKQNPSYKTFHGIEYPSNHVIDQIHAGTEMGHTVVMRELMMIESYERLLKDRRLL